MFRSMRVLTLTAFLALSVAACRKTPPTTEVPTPLPPPNNPGPGNNPTAPPPTDTGRADEERRLAIARTETALLTNIYFAYDKAELDGAAQSSLEMKAQILRANPAVRIRIEGHADERGST
jgi:peptidoglycan-associated lipoprotein